MRRQDRTARAGAVLVSRRGVSSGAVVLWCAVISAGAVALWSTVVAWRRFVTAQATKSETPPVSVLQRPTEPIVSEAEVFHTRVEALAIGEFTTPRRSANPRTLHSYRTRRAYPGAPPQIPHGLTGEEFRAGNCTTCHERGGFSPRFGAYVPVTPHPEMGPCLQCHVGFDGVTGVALPSYDPNTICRQCHDPDAPKANPAAQWRTTVWPSLWAKTANAPPPPIPHELTVRSNCLACHAGPAAVPEIRTTHPERTNCRQCHVAAEEDPGPYVRGTPQGGDR